MLKGKTIVVTHAHGQNDELVDDLLTRGASVLELPAIAIAPPDDLAPLDAALLRIRDFSFVVVGSKNAAHAVASRATALGVDLGQVGFVAIGERTSKWLLGRGFKVVLSPHVYRSEALVEEVLRHFGPDLSGHSILIPSASDGRGLISSALAAAGATVVEPIAYRIAYADPPNASELARLVSADGIVFLSGKTLEAFVSLVPAASLVALWARAKVAVIGPVAKERADALGLRVDIVPSQATIPDLIDAIDLHFASG